MKTFTKALKSIALIAFGIILTRDSEGITVNSTANADTLVNAIVGPGISVVPGSTTFSGGATAAGTFSGGLSSGLSINSGILLTTGDASLAPGPNSSESSTADHGLGGDSQLETLTTSSTFDATILEFDFTTAGGNLFFNYVFASEEYNEWVNSSFNDVFGFFLDGENIALIPGTSIPVSINTVNGGNPLGTDASHPEFFNNNDLDPANDSVLGVHNLEYDGFTATFTAQALNLAPGTHHIKLAIADVSDRFLDSGVFIQGNSFSDNPTDPDDVPEGGGVAILGLAFLGAARRWFKSH